MVAGGGRTEEDRGGFSAGKRKVKAGLTLVLSLSK